MDIKDFQADNITAFTQLWKENEKYSYLKKARPNHGICFVRSGEIKYTMRGGDIIIAAAGNAVYLPQNSEYKAEFLKPTQDILVNFTADEILSDKAIIFTFDKISSESERYFENLLKYSFPLSPFALKENFYGLINSLISVEEDDFKAEINSWAKTGEIFFMDETAMAKKLCVSVSTLQRKFKSKIGKNPSEYKEFLRIEKAKNYLLENRLSISEIADELGYCDGSHFSKAFSRATGINPKRYADRG